MNIYLAGPMRGIPEFNFPEFDRVAEKLRRYGHFVFSPAQRDREVAEFDPRGMTGDENLAAFDFDLRAALAADTDWIAQNAEAVAVLPGWERSAGAQAEVALAHALHIPVLPFDAFMKMPASGELPYHEDVQILPPPLPPAAPALARGGVLTVTGAVHTATLPEPAPPATFGTFHIGEVRTVSSTGGEKGTKLERFDLIPQEALATVARHYGIGAQKYEDHNWRRGYEWSKSYAAMQRHASDFWAGVDIDPETQSPHMAAVAFHALTLLTFMVEQPDFDDRYRKDTKQ